MFGIEQSTPAGSRQRRFGGTSLARAAAPAPTFKLRALTAALMLWPCVGSAVEFATGIDDLALRWDNTFKYSAAYRLKNPSAKLTSPAENSNNVNQDDGDRNFNRGVISNRLDLLSEFDATYKDTGLRVSAAAWYDSVYNRTNDNPGFAGGAFPNNASVPYNEFTDDTRDVHGRRVELLDAFVFGNIAVGEQGRLAARLGRHGMVWGETLFFGTNGIAGGMMPVDVVKLVSVPNTQFKEAIRPVPMASAQWQITPDTALGAYYQFRWAASQLPTVGSYFSASDIAPAGGEQLLLAGPGSPFLANAANLGDVRPKNSGQGGLQFKTRAGDYDLGAYLIRFHEKAPQPVVSLGVAPVTFVPGPGCVIPGSFPTGPASCGFPGPVGFRMVYQEDITSFGLSASKTFGDFNVATEVSVRRNMPLASGRTADITALLGAGANDNDDNPAYPVAKTAHVNISTIWTLPPNALFREGSLVGEIGWNRVLSVQRNAASVDPSSSRDAVAVRGVMQATYRQVIAGLDVAPLFGLGWAPKGSRSPITATSMPQNGNGDVTLGFDFTYLDVWRASLAATHYFGSEAGLLVPADPVNNSLSYRQFSRDRDFVALSIRRSF